MKHYVVTVWFNYDIIKIKKCNSILEIRDFLAANKHKICRYKIVIKENGESKWEFEG